MGAKEAYLEEVDVRLRECRGRLDFFVNRIERSPDDVGERIRLRIEAVEAKQEEMEAELGELWRCEEGWRDVREDIERVRREVEQGLEEIRERFVA